MPLVRPSAEGLPGGIRSRRRTRPDVVRVTLIGTAVLALLVSDGLLRWTDERIDLIDGPLTGWIEPAIRGFDNALRSVGIGRLHGSIRARARELESERFADPQPPG
jgi:hypothetical protein